ncbi:hypothetical protein COOONC_21453 [Cooperia oncophora]
MLRRPLTSIEIKADDIDHMERVLLEAYQKKGATKSSVDSDAGSTSFGTPASEGQYMEKYGYTKPKKPMGKRIVFKDDDDNDVIEVPGNSGGKEKSKPSQGRKVIKKKDYHKDAKLKSWRMIIRNLPFKVCFYFFPGCGHTKTALLAQL